MNIPTPLQALAGYPQFILWKLVQDSPTEKPTKLPVSPRTGQVVNAHDPSHWVSYDEAVTRSRIFDVSGIAFVITREAGFWFLDIDNCLQEDGQWSPLAQQLCGLFAGAAIEISQSGKGLHIFGRGTMPQHGCKNVALKIELYSDQRFVALTGTGAVGDASLDFSHVLPNVIDAYFPYDPNGDMVAGDEAWSDTPDPAWSGPTEDVDLISRMLQSRPTSGQLLHGKASVQDLWTANRDALRDAFPPNDESKMWDYSQADAALAQHLAFWTGKNNERIRRLMWMSGLRRDKWQQHRRYLWLTVSRACHQQRDVYNVPTPQVQAQQAAVQVAPQRRGGALVSTPAAELTTGPQWMTAQGQPDFFSRCVYVLDKHCIWTPEGAFLKKDQFRVRYGGFTFNLDVNNDKTTRNAWEAFTESQSIRFPKADTTCFRPELPSGCLIHEEGRTLLNTYVGVDTDRVAGDASPFLRHIAKLLPDERDQQILIAYMAALVQYPGRKFQWCPVLQGMEGNGKTLVITAMSFAIGRRYTHLPNASELGGNGTKFNSWIMGNLFIGIEEITLQDRTDTLNALKPLITNDRLEVQGKGENQITGDNRANFIMCTNYRDAIPVSTDKRRYAIFYTAQQHIDDMHRDGMMGRYFPDLYVWLREEDGFAIVNNYLRDYKIPDELNPATLCQRAPHTSSTAAAIRESGGHLEQEIQEAIDEGRRGFGSPWVNSFALDTLIRERGGRAKLSYRKRREIMESLGYIWHPALNEGRMNNAMPGDPGKPRLYVKKDSLARHLSTPAAIIEHYLQSQGTLAVIEPPVRRIG